MLAISGPYVIRVGEFGITLISDRFHYEFRLLRDASWMH